MQVRESIWLAAQAVGVIIVTAVIVVTATLGFFVSIMYITLAVDCIPEIDRSIRSPDEKLAAVIYMSHCGTFASDTTSISIDQRTQRFSPEKSNPFFVIKDDPGFNVRWTGDRTLEVTVPQEKRIYKQERTADGVTIEYK